MKMAGHDPSLTLSSSIENISSSTTINYIDESKPRTRTKDTTTDAKLQSHKLVPLLLYPDPTGLPKLRISFSAIAELPVGLEFLKEYKNLVVHRRPENAIALDPDLRLSGYTQYDIVDTDGRQLYLGLELATYDSINYFRDARPFAVTLYDRNRGEVLTVKRIWSCSFCFAQYYCLCCIYGFKGCGNEALVTLADGQLLGRIVQKFSCQQTILDIYDNTETPVMSICGQLVDGIFDITGTIDDGDDDVPVGIIDTSMTPMEVMDFYKLKMANYEDPYGITFFSPDLSPQKKALIISAIILMDFMFCKPNGDYPHWTQFMPPDFKTEPTTHEKTFRDESKEIIVTSMRPRPRRQGLAHREEGHCGGCLWFFKVICMCCPLGMTRNAFRCSQLIAFAIITTLLLAGIIYIKFLGSL